MDQYQYANKDKQSNAANILSDDSDLQVNQQLIVDLSLPFHYHMTTKPSLLIVYDLALNRLRLKLPHFCQNVTRA